MFEDAVVHHNHEDDVFFDAEDNDGPDDFVDSPTGFLSFFFFFVLFS